MSDFSIDAYKRLRNRAWLGLMLIWIVGGYLYCQHLWDTEIAQYTAAQTAAEKACAAVTGLTRIGCMASASTMPGTGIATLDFDFRMIGIVLVSPFMFFPARFVARRYMASAEASATRAEEAKQARQREQQDRESAARIAQNEAESDALQRQISRSEVIHKLGTISDLADLLPAESDQERMMNIRHGVAQALRDLAAKYTAPELAGLIKSDPVIEHTARTVVERLDGSPLRTIVEIQALRLASQ